MFWSPVVFAVSASGASTAVALGLVQLLGVDLNAAVAAGAVSGALVGQLTMLAFTERPGMGQS
jgi:hypothetical protein